MDFGVATPWVAVTAEGSLGYATDGMGVWQASPDSGRWTDLRDVAAGLDRFIAVGAREQMLLSDDGLTWAEVVDPYPSGVLEFERVFYAGNGEWAAVGADGASSRVLVSYDHGSTWEDAGSPFGAGATVTGLGVHRSTGRWVAVGAPGDRVAHATRHVASRLGGWTQVAAVGGSSVAAGAGLSAVTHGPGGWVAVGPQGNAVRSSDDGLSWQYLSPLCAGRSLSTVVSGPVRSVALGAEGCATESATGDEGQWAAAPQMPAPAADAAISSGLHAWGLDRVFFGNTAGQIGYSTDTRAGWSLADTTAVFSGTETVVGIASYAPGPVRVELYLSPMASALCPISLPARDAALVAYLPDMNLPGTEDGQPVRLGVATTSQGVMAFAAGLRVSISGDYRFRARIGSGDAIEVEINGASAVGCYGTAGGPIALSASEVATLEVRWEDDGWEDALILSYAGPDTDGAWEVVPTTAFVRML